MDAYDRRLNRIHTCAGSITLTEGLTANLQGIARPRFRQNDIIGQIVRRRRTNHVPSGLKHLNLFAIKRTEEDFEGFFRAFCAEEVFRLANKRTLVDSFVQWALREPWQNLFLEFFEESFEENVAEVGNSRPSTMSSQSTIGESKEFRLVCLLVILNTTKGTLTSRKGSGAYTGICDNFIVDLQQTPGPRPTLGRVHIDDIISTTNILSD